MKKWKALFELMLMIDAKHSFPVSMGSSAILYPVFISIYYWYGLADRMEEAAASGIYMQTTETSDVLTTLL